MNLRSKTYDDYEQLDDVARPSSLLPPVCKWIGAALAVGGALLYAAWLFGLVAEAGTGVTYAAGTTAMIGLAVAASSRERDEDELTRKLRLESVHWSLFIGVGLLVGANTGYYLLQGEADLYSGTALMIVLLLYHLIRFHTARRRLASEGTEVG